MSKVFISYSRADHAYVEKLVDCLVDAGVPTWFDRLTAPGDLWSEEIRARIESSLSVVVVMTPSAEASQWVIREINHAERHGKTIVPLLLAGKVFFSLSHIHYEDVTAGVMPGAQILARLLDPAGAGQTPRRTLPTPESSNFPKTWNVPRPTLRFIGRESLIAELRSTLLRAEQPVALCGIGGVGKTTLAYEYARRFASDFELVWRVDAEQPLSISSQLVELAIDLGVATVQSPPRLAESELRAWLRRHHRWLLIFDNVSKIDQVWDSLPDGVGQVLLTSRDARWSQVVEVVSVDVLPRSESIKLLAKQLPTIATADADAVATAVGDLPLALLQAAGFMSETGMSPGEYLDEFRAHASTLLHQGRPPAGYPQPLAAAVALSVERLAGVDPRAAELLRTCATLGPGPIPFSWTLGAPSKSLDGPVGGTAESSVGVRASIGRLMRFGLAQRTADGEAFTIHRTTSAVVRDLTPADERDRRRERAEELLVAARPGEPNEVSTWGMWSQVAAHVSVGMEAGIDVRRTGSAAYRSLVLDAARYLECAAQGEAASLLAARARAHWSRTLGEDHVDTLRAAQRQSATLPPGHPEALPLEQDIYGRRRRLLGPENPETLESANNLAMALADLGRHEEARRLDEQTLARRREIFGDDHPRTLLSINNLANRLSALGEYEAARALREEALNGRRRALGEDHPDTLRAQIGLARDLANTGEREEGERLGKAALAECSRVLGPDHRATLSAAAVLAEVLRRAGNYGAARVLDQDTLERRRRVLGEDHAETITSMRSLILDCIGSGDRAGAERIRADLARIRPDTLPDAAD